MIGAGAMGSGIAVAGLSSDYEVTLVDLHKAARARAQAFVGKKRKGDAPFSLRQDLEALGDGDLIIEALLEDMDAKKTLL